MSLSELDVFTLFPHWFAWLSEETRPVQRAARAARLRLRFLSLRDYSPLPHAQVDDAPFGGGAGMLLRVDVMVAARRGRLRRRRSRRCARERRIVALDPGGRPLRRRLRARARGGDRVTLLCGPLRGLRRRDPRARRHRVAVASGPFVLARRRAGGDGRRRRGLPPPARARSATTASSEEESFSPALDGALEYPHYTRPEEFRGWRVPEVLLSGHHATHRRVARASRPRARRADDRGRLTLRRSADRLPCGRSSTPEPRFDHAHERHPPNSRRASCARCRFSRPATPCASTFR